MPITKEEIVNEMSRILYVLSDGVRDEITLETYLSLRSLMFKIKNNKIRG